VDADRAFAHTSTVALFKEIAMGKYLAFTSEYVVKELDATINGYKAVDICNPMEVSESEPDFNA
jgi:hypothetical protein